MAPGQTFFLKQFKLCVKTYCLETLYHHIVFPHCAHTQALDAADMADGGPEPLEDEAAADPDSSEAESGPSSVHDSDTTVELGAHLREDHAKIAKDKRLPASPESTSTFDSEDDDGDDVPNLAADSKGNTDYGFNLAALVGPPPKADFGDKDLITPPKRPAPPFDFPSAPKKSKREVGHDNGESEELGRIEFCGGGFHDPTFKNYELYKPKSWVNIIIYRTYRVMHKKKYLRVPFSICH